MLSESLDTFFIHGLGIRMDEDLENPQVMPEEYVTSACAYSNLKIMIDIIDYHKSGNQNRIH